MHRTTSAARRTVGVLTCEVQLERLSFGETGVSSGQIVAAVLLADHPHVLIQVLT